MKKCVDASSVRGKSYGEREARSGTPPLAPTTRTFDCAPPPPPRRSRRPPRAAAARGTARRNVSYAKTRGEGVSEASSALGGRRAGAGAAGSRLRVAVAERERREPGWRDTHGACVRHLRAARPAPLAAARGAPPRRQTPPRARRPAATASPSSPRPVFPEKNPSPKNRPPARSPAADVEREAPFASSLMIFSVSTEPIVHFVHASRALPPWWHARAGGRSRAPPRKHAELERPARRATR